MLMCKWSQSPFKSFSHRPLGNAFIRSSPCGCTGNGDYVATSGHTGRKSTIAVSRDHGRNVCGQVVLAPSLYHIRQDQHKQIERMLAQGEKLDSDNITTFRGSGSERYIAISQLGRVVTMVGHKPV
jgi:hypothetical protein